MPLRSVIAQLIIANICLLMLTTAVAESEQRLSGEAIRALYSGKIVEGEHRLRNYRFRSFYHPSGEFHSYRSGDSQLLKGHWWIKGDKICIRWLATGEQYCRHVYQNSSGDYRKSLIKRNGREVDVVRYRSFVEGQYEELRAFE